MSTERALDLPLANELKICTNVLCNIVSNVACRDGKITATGHIKIVIMNRDCIVYNDATTMQKDASATAT